MRAVRPSYWPSRPHISSNSKFFKEPSETDIVLGLAGYAARSACEFALWSVAAPSVKAYVTTASARCKREFAKIADFPNFFFDPAAI